MTEPGKYPDYIKHLSNEELNKRVESYQRTPYEEEKMEMAVWYMRFFHWLFDWTYWRD